MGEFVTLSEADVEIFRRIPRRTHKLRVFQSFPESFTGKEAITFLKTAFDIKSDEEAHRWASLLMQANVIKNANYRYAKSFDSRSKFIYVLGPIEEQNLFWLDLDSYTKDEPNILERRMSVVDHADPSELVGLKEVPEMPALPFIGNAFDVAGPLDTHRSMCILGREICQKYDGIFKISLMGHEFIVVSDPEIVQTIFESPHFGKNTENDAIFKELRTFRGEGLTTVSDGPLHDQCQGVVAPKLVKSCFARYVPIIAETMNQCFREELGTSKNDVDFRWFWKKCTLRSVGKIAMGIDLYEGKKWKSFIENLTFVADEAINRVFKGTNLIPIFNYKFKKAVKSMQKKLLKVVQERREQHLLHGKNEDKYDLLDVMLTTPLRKDGKGNEVFMNDELIRANLVTILSAGHSTTTCMLSWSCNYLYDVSLGNSDYRYALIQEIASISNGDRRYIPTVEDVYKKMNMMTCILKESLRLSPPIPTIVRHAFQSTNLHGYRIKKGDTLMISCLGTHLNPKSWSDPLTFNPLRFERDVPHPCSFIPWAGGPRQCIGREFALLTGRIGLFLLMNQYSLELSPNARVREDEHLFVFPEGLFMNAVIRKDMIKRVGERKSSTNATRSESTGPASEPGSPGPSDGERAWDGLKALIRESGHQVTILSGTKSQVGNTNTIAQMCLRKALDFNFKTGDSPIAPDNYFPDISPPTKFSIVAVCVATYNGNPPPNTKQAYEWLKSMVTRLENGEQKLASYLTNIHYFVFGCGNKNWATTFNKIGKFFDENLVKLGAKRMCPAGFFDESSDDIEEVFSEFYKVMAPKLMHSLPEIGDKRLRAVDASSIQKSIKSSPSVSAQPASSAFQLDILGDAEDIGMPPIIPSSTHSKVFSCTIRTILDITPKAERSTLHIEFNLEENMKYRAGDHLVVCPVIPDEIVYRVINRFVDYDESTVLRWSPQVRVTSTNQFPLPVSTPMTVGNIFRNLVDLKAQPSKQFLINYSTIVEDPAHEQELKQIVQSISAYKAWLSSNIPISNYQIIEQYPPRLTELGRLIEILPILKPRPYSISSSPNLVNNQVHLCVGVVEDEYKEKNQTYQGTCSYYLKTLIANPETPVNVFVEPADEKFDCPKDDNIPMIMVSAGTGFAPMRSFLQERKARRAKGEIYVFFGCRNENTDWLYSAELLEYQREGFITGMWVGYSRSSNHPRQYVQDKILEQSELVWKALDDKGAYIYVCGSGTRVGVGTRDALLKIIAEQSNKGEDFASEYINQLQQDGRYEQDVWG